MPFKRSHGGRCDDHAALAIGIRWVGAHGLYNQANGIEGTHQIDRYHPRKRTQIMRARLALHFLPWGDSRAADKPIYTAEAAQRGVDRHLHGVLFNRVRVHE
ncbi:hypothetical protein D3C76_1594950 [compost metagenome]